MNKQDLHDRAKVADEAFQAECVRQFGKDAGDKRYQSKLHDDRTRLAREAFRAAMDAIHNA